MLCKGLQKEKGQMNRKKLSTAKYGSRAEMRMELHSQEQAEQSCDVEKILAMP